jgi:hypothetical protein
VRNLPAIPISSNSEHCNRDMARVGNGVKENQTQERSAVTKTCTRARGGAVCARGGAGELRKYWREHALTGTVPSCRPHDTYSAAEPAAVQLDLKLPSGPASTPPKIIIHCQRFGSAHKRFLHNDVSGKDTHSCSEAAFMHALMKLQSRKYVR